MATKSTQDGAYKNGYDQAKSGDEPHSPEHKVGRPHFFTGADEDEQKAYDEGYARGQAERRNDLIKK
ncbi:MAG: hypothetical protein WA021_00375 [Minisyncoccia bacterium]